jgi:ABC-type multidrug transport system ATPase subunit
VNWVLEVDSVGKRFGRRDVLHAASLRAAAGAVTFLVGRNGCGKTTLLRIATGFLPIESGYVRFDGVMHPRPRLRRLAHLGVLYLPDRDVLSNAFTVRAQLDLMWRQLGRADGGVPADEAGETVGLTVLGSHRPNALSAGERRRAEMALAVCRNPRCLLVDEPFRHLAPADAAIVQTTLRSLADRGCAVVVTGHEVASLFDVADQVTWCTAGTTYAIGTPADARRQWRFCREYLGGSPVPSDGSDADASGAAREAARD